MSAPGEPRVAGVPGRALKRPPVLGRTAAVLAALLVLAGAAYALTRPLGGSESHPPAATPTVPPGAQPPPPGFQSPYTPPPTGTQPTAAPTPAGSAAYVTWLGMQIQTVSGAAVVDTVAIGSAADRAGINPGDVILEVNNRQVRDATGVASAIRGMGRGTRIPLLVSHGSGLTQTEITLAAAPSVHP